MIICSLLCKSFLQQHLLFSSSKLGRLTWLYLQGLMFLIYLLLGHVADVWLTKHCMLKCALVFRWQLGYLCSNCCGCNYYEAFFATFSHHNGVFKFPLFTDVAFLLPLAIVCIFKFTVCILISGGIFEANCHSVWVRSTTPKLITFIHWYYWSQNLGGLLRTWFNVARSLC